ncbi:hypothetical protein HMPREF0555_1834 [Leuconostoc mesenteroides subsp. cremoris ATCC 19254]|uniref:Uncharacterized protein n=2 Tax=Leuconostoc mesenteroides TaxID=1245 RepID=C2KMG8_LEUMC|nr:hypothetical protein HMPREF0555_1834 [Leuconostoc mesenteroides subsp. cremoris ATCC 19254]
MHAKRISATLLSAKEKEFHMSFKKFIVSKGVIGALIIVLFYGLLMVGIYFSGYKVVPSKINQLPVAIVNQDKDSTTLKKQLKKKLAV